jgi:type IV secretory pathway TraG/TraD family ATPase VirD4
MQELKPFTPIGVTNWRNHNKLFGIKPTDRLSHIFLLGKSGTGKSNLIINMVLDDVIKNQGICLLDPHADTARAILRRIPDHRKQDLVYFDATNANALPAFNPLAHVPESQRQLVASEMISTFKRLFPDAFGSRMEYILRFAIATLLEHPGSTLLDINALLTDKSFRADVLKSVRNPYVLSFWQTDYDLYPASSQASAILPILNKIGVLLANDTLRGIFGQASGISFEECMNEGKVVLCNLSKGEVGEDVATVLGSFITTAIQNAAMRRASMPESRRKAFYLYIDEAQNFVSTSFATMLPQVRKFGVGLLLANQHLSQLDAETKSAILANFGSLIVFRIGLEDAKVMEKDFYPVFTYDDFISLPKYHIYVKLMIDGAESKGFSAITIESYS